MMLIRDYHEADREAVLALADRLMIGVAPWRDADAVATTIRGWVIESIDRTDGAVFVAVLDGAVAGFVSVARRQHWAGAVDAYVGELVTAANAENRGVGRALLERAEQWARDRGYERITLETGAANARALSVYEHLGWAAEDVRLSKPLHDGLPQPQPTPQPTATQ